MAEQKSANRLRRSRMPAGDEGDQQRHADVRPVLNRRVEHDCQSGRAGPRRVAERRVPEGEALVEGRDDETERVDGLAGDHGRRLCRPVMCCGPATATHAP